MASPPRPTWQGHLRLSLVSCPVALYTAVNAAGDVHFHLINPKTNNRINMITVDPETGPVKRSDLVKGFEVAKGQYVLVSNDEIRSVKLESTKVIDIDRFVPATDIDRTYWDHPYYLAPDGKMAEEAFGVIREAMERAGQIALGRVVLSTRERILALEPHDNGMMAYSLRSKDEVRSAAEIFGAIADTKPDEEMIAIAEKIIEQKEGPFDPGTFVDRYEGALKALIARKQKGEAVEEVAEPEDTNVIDLMAALRASLGDQPADKAARKPGAKAAPAKRKAPAAKRKAG
jgi:DNA end-binding protein Ku